MLEHRATSDRITTTTDQYRQMNALADAGRLVWHHCNAQLQQEYQQTNQCQPSPFEPGQKFTGLRQPQQTSRWQAFSSYFLRHNLQPMHTQDKHFFKDFVNSSFAKVQVQGVFICIVAP